MSNRAWVTLATNDSYGLGALVLAHSLRRASSSYPAVVLITPSVTEPMRERLRAVFAEVIVVDVLDSRDAAHLALLQRPELGITFTKIHCWNLTQYEKCVFLDADTLIVQNCDELFEREQLSAAPDVGWPDCFNSGVFVFTPSADTFNELIAFAKERGSFDGGDQGLLNSFFSDWARGDINKHLPFLYNVTSAAFYSYLPALKQFGQDLKIIHFIGAAKPWLQQYNFESGTIDAPEHIRGLLQLWWDIFVSQVHRQLDTGMVEVDEPSEAPEIPPQDVSHEYHYRPILDPQSEFAWHHPVIENTTDPGKEQIEITDFFNPWDIYRGNIPAKIDNEPTHHLELGRVANQEEIRNYVWDYQHERNNQQLEKLYTEQQWQQQQNIQTYHSDHFYQHYSQQHDTHADQHWYNSEPHDKQTHRSDHQHQHYSEYHDNHSNSDHWQYHHQLQHNQMHDTDHHGEHFSQQHNKQEYHTDHHWKPDFPQTNNETHFTDNIWQYNPHQNHNQTDIHWQHQHYNQTINEKFHDSSQQRENQTYDTNNFEHYTSLHAEHHVHRPYVDTINHNHNENHSHNEYSYINHHNDDHHNDISSYTCPMNQSEHTEHNDKNDTINENESVHCFQVEVQAEKGSRRKRKPHPIDIYGNKDSIINGDISENESDSYEEILPRHPYDDFYLRHRVTIDARGRKICSHEIPPTPTPSPPDSPLPMNAYDDEDDESSPTNNFDIHSGVAGNLARVLPGADGQREALDELTRRQGWEAGNIDYMGADSFDNIWAKISQTLSKPRSSPPKQQSPPKEVAPTESIAEQIPVQSGVVAEEPVSEQVEEAKEAVPVDSSAPEKEAPIPSETIAPAEVPVTVENIASTPVQEAPVATEVSPPVPTPIPAEMAIPLEAPVTKEVVPAVDAVAVELPANDPTPSNDIPVTVEATEITAAVKDVAVEAPVASEADVKTAGEAVKVVEQPEQKSDIPLPEETSSEPIVVPTAEVTISAEPIKTDPLQTTEVAAPATVETSVVVTDQASAPDAPIVAESTEAAAASTTETVDVPITASVETPDTVASETPATVASEAPATVANEAPATVASEAPATVASETPTTVASEAPATVASEAPATVVGEGPTITSEAPVAVAAETPVADATVLAETTTAPVTESVEAVAAVTAETAAPVTVETPATVTAETPATVTAETPEAGADTTPEKSKLETDQAVTDSPPLVITPSKEEVPVVSPAKSEERRKPAGKLKLVPPAAADPLPTPDSELEDAATLAQSIIASELHTPTVTSPEPAAAPVSSTSPPLAPSVTQSLSVEEPEVPTPPVGSVSLSQIGVKTAPKGKSTTAAQIESSIVEPAPSEVAAESVAAAKPATSDVPKKKIIKKVVKKEAGATGADAPVPPPRKKEKKPKEK